MALFACFVSSYCLIIGIVALHRSVNADLSSINFHNTLNSNLSSSLRVSLDSTSHNQISDYGHGHYSVTRTLKPAWSEWTEWSFCSNSCGNGVAMRTRSCEFKLQIVPSYSCSGSDVQHMICKLDPCGESSVDPRALQCAVYDQQPLFTSTLKWIPYHDENVEPCILTCIAEGYNYYRSFGAVLDGTLCSKDRYDICVDGKCLKAGCDQILGSNLTKDACGVCGGNNSTCLYYSDSYKTKPSNVVEYVYNKVTVIPKGATRIRIKEGSLNYIALTENNGFEDNYIMNGNWVIGWSGDFSGAGTLFKYERTGNKEEITAEGPTTSEVHIMLLYLSDEPEVEFEYWIPLEIEPDYEVGEFKAGQELSYPSNFENEYFENIYDDMILVESTTKALTTSTAKTTSFSLLKTTVINTSTSATALKPTVNSNLEAGTRHKKKVKKSRCSQCRKPKDRRSHYCSSDFAIHGRVLSKRRVRGKLYRYDIKIKSIYKTGFTMMKREYLWTFSSCCPKLRPLREYLIMGKKQKVELKESTQSGSSGIKPKRYETRLAVTSTDYWRVWKKRYQRGMNRIANRAKCKKF